MLVTAHNPAHLAHNRPLDLLRHGLQLRLTRKSNSPLETEGWLELSGTSHVGRPMWDIPR